MIDSISNKELRRIINRAITGCDGFSCLPINKEISLFYERYKYQCKNQKQLNVFEDTIVAKKDLIEAKNFCDALEVYRQSTDCYAKENIPLDEQTYRKIYEGINYFRSYIDEDNTPLLNTLEYIAKRHLPEFKEEVLLSEYNKQATRIYDMKRGYERQRRKNQQPTKNYESAAQNFFNEVLDNPELRKIKGCPQKLELYENCLKIIDCLPASQYSRVAKFALKRDFNRAIRVTASSLGEEYKEIAEKAYYEEGVFQKSIERTQNFIGKQKSKFLMSEISRYKRDKDEWYYK